MSPSPEKTHRNKPLPTGGINPVATTDHVLPTLAIGITCGFLSVMTSVAFAALVFSGPLSPHLAEGVQIMLLTAVISGFIVAAFSSYPGVVAIPQDRVAPIIAAIVASITVQFSATATDATRFHTVIAAIFLISILTGVFLTVLGVFRLARLIRFVPYSVIGGFFASNGWLLSVGALRMLLTGGDTADLSELQPLLPQVLALWTPAILVAVVLLLVLHRHRHFYVLPVVLIATIAGFYAALFLGGISIAEASSRAWMIGPLPALGGWHYLALDAFRNADWSLVVQEPGSVAAVLAVSAMSILLTATALEISSGRDLDLNQELRVAGCANLLGGAAGCMVGFHSLSLSTLALKFGVQGRLLGMVGALVGAVVLIVGIDLLAYIPRGVVAGLLLFLGLSMLKDWLYDTWFTLSRADYAIVLLILSVVAVAGFLLGVTVGLLTATIFFVVNYSRISVVTLELSGAEQKSNVDWAPVQARLLHDQAGQIYMLKLQGFIFFGSANGLLEKISHRTESTDTATPHFVLLDFRRVVGLDSSANLSFIRLRQLAARRKFQLIFTGVAHLAQQLNLEHSGADNEEFRIFEDADHGLEWCERQILHTDAATKIVHGWQAFLQQLSTYLPAGVRADRLQDYVEILEVPPGQLLFTQGTASDDVYFIDKGWFSVLYDLGNGEEVRLRKTGPGTSIGELGVFTGGGRSASARADTQARVCRLSRTALSRLEQEEPQLALAFHWWMAKLLSERVSEATYALRNILK